MFTPYVALEQARQMALCLAGICGFCLFTLLVRIQKKVALLKDLHWDVIRRSAV